MRGALVQAPSFGPLVLWSFGKENANAHASLSPENLTNQIAAPPAWRGPLQIGAQNELGVPRCRQESPCHFTLDLSIEPNRLTRLIRHSRVSNHVAKTTAFLCLGVCIVFFGASKKDSNAPSDEIQIYAQTENWQSCRAVGFGSALTHFSESGIKTAGTARTLQIVKPILDHGAGMVFLRHKTMVLFLR